VEGGAVVPLLDVPNGAGHSWSEDGSILMGSQRSGGLMRISPAGGKAILFSVYHRGENSDAVTIEVLTLPDRRRKVVARGGVNPMFVPSGHLIYSNKASRFAIPFDLDKLETHGTAVPVLDAAAYRPAPELRSLFNLCIRQFGLSQDHWQHVRVFHRRLQGKVESGW
jgi:hypothetical protein